MGPDSRHPARPRQVHFLVLAPASHPVIVRRQGGGAMNLSGTVPTDRASCTDWVAVAAELAAAFAARAVAHDADDRFVFENYAELRRRRMFSAAVPAELGGGGASHAELCEVLRTLARGCSSTALALSMHTHQVLIPVWRWRHERAPVDGLLRRIAADELVLASSGGSDWLAGSGRADKVDGGYRVTARKIFASGAPAADLFSTMAVHEDPAEGPTVVHFVIPLDAPGVKVHDNWRTLGVREAARRRDDHAVHELVGAMDTELTAARLAWRSMVEAANRGRVGADTTNDVMIGRTLAGQGVLRTVETAMEAAGGAAFFRSAGLERLFRDAQGARYHALRGAAQRRYAGRLALGVDIDD